MSPGKCLSLESFILREEIKLLGSSNSVAILKNEPIQFLLNKYTTSCRGKSDNSLLFSKDKKIKSAPGALCVISYLP
jgi:hypothetical protein